MINAIFDFLISIPVPCLIGLAFGIAIVFVPILQKIEYSKNVKKYGERVAWELARRY